MKYVDCRLWALRTAGSQQGVPTNTQHTDSSNREDKNQVDSTQRTRTRYAITEPYLPDVYDTTLII